MDHRLQRALDFLNRAKIRATYGAVGQALGNVHGQAVGQMLGERRPEASWVVNTESGEPSGYEDCQIHPELRSRARILRGGEELLRCMAGLDPDFDSDLVASSPADLQWSAWTPWSALAIEARPGEGVAVPAESGVYEVRRKNQEARLTIGKASDLRMRVKQGLVRGNTPHSSGEAIRARERLEDLEVRWALTDRPSAVEEELHRSHRHRFGNLPEYVWHT